MEPNTIVTILLFVCGILVSSALRSLYSLKKDIKEVSDNLVERNEKCQKINNRLIVVETRMDNCHYCNTGNSEGK